MNPVPISELWALVSTRGTIPRYKSFEALFERHLGMIVQQA
jgi:hypothetical protein